MNDDPIIVCVVEFKTKNHLQSVSLQVVMFVVRAQNRTRTCTAVRPLVPETSVSTNFTIWADGYSIV